MELSHPHYTISPLDLAQSDWDHLNMATTQDDMKKADPSEVEMLSVAEATEAKEDEGIKLKAEMTLMNGCTVIIGCIIGSGIFVSPTGVLQGTGSVNFSIVVWIICGLFTMIGEYKNKSNNILIT